MSEIVQSSDDLIVIQTDSGATILEANAGGSTGPQGQTGATGPQGPGFTWRGNWNSASAYAVQDVVLYNANDGGDNRAYVCIQTAQGSGQSPSGNSAYWSLLVQRSPSAVVLGPYESTRVLGFVNSCGTSIQLSNETIRPSNSATVEWRKVNGTSASLPITLQQGDLYEVRLNSVTGRVYVGYEAA